MALNPDDLRHYHAEINKKESVGDFSLKSVEPLIGGGGNRSEEYVYVTEAIKNRLGRTAVRAYSSHWSDELSLIYKIKNKKGA